MLYNTCNALIQMERTLLIFAWMFYMQTTLHLIAYPSHLDCCLPTSPGYVAGSDCIIQPIHSFVGDRRLISFVLSWNA